MFSPTSAELAILGMIDPLDPIAMMRLSSLHTGGASGGDAFGFKFTLNNTLVGVCSCENHRIDG